MNISATLTEKKTTNTELKKNYGLFQKYKPLGLIKLSNSELTNELIEWLKVLSAGFIVVLDNVDEIQVAKNVFITNNVDTSALAWFDFVVGDNDLSQISNYTNAGVTPIINKDNHLNSILKEFNPLKNEWNSFYYEELNHWAVFYTIVRYMENYKFPFDNKNLVKNVLSV